MAVDAIKSRATCSANFSYNVFKFSLICVASCYSFQQAVNSFHIYWSSNYFTSCAIRTNGQECFMHICLLNKSYNTQSMTNQTFQTGTLGFVGFRLFPCNTTVIEATIKKTTDYFCSLSPSLNKTCWRNYNSRIKWNFFSIHIFVS
jgi:hypothetical protein